MYNYGYRDYAPWQGRFTTVDPIRDGFNCYAYCENNPVNLVDLWGLSASDGKKNKPTMQYFKDGRFFKKVKDNVGGIEIVERKFSLGSVAELSSKDIILKLITEDIAESEEVVSLGHLKDKLHRPVSISDFDSLTIAVVGEASNQNNMDEANGIADVIMNRVVFTKESIIYIVENTGIYGQRTDAIERGKNNKKKNTDRGILNARAAVIDSCIGYVDTSNRAFFWDGKDLKTNKRHLHRSWGFVFTDPSHDIYKIKNIFIPKTNTYWDPPKNTNYRGSFTYKIESTAAYGGTIFFKYSEHYKRVSGQKDYP